MTRQKFRKIATAGLLGLASLLGGCRIAYETKHDDGSVSRFNCGVSVGENQDPTIEKKERKPEPSQGAYYTGTASASYATKFVADNIVLGRGPVVQSQVNVERNGNFINGDSIRVGAFGNYDIRDGNIVEADFSVEVKKPIFFWENLMKGYGNPAWGDSAFLGYQFRQYPDGLLGTNENYDHVLNAGFLHSSRADLKFDWLHLLPDVDTREGDLFRFTGSKKIQLGKIFDRDFFINPFVSTAYAYNWYGIDGFTAVTSGVDVTFEKDKSVIGGRVQCQSSLNSDVKDVLYAGAEIGFKF